MSEYPSGNGLYAGTQVMGPDGPIFTRLPDGRIDADELPTVDVEWIEEAINWCEQGIASEEQQQWVAKLASFAMLAVREMKGPA